MKVIKSIAILLLSSAIYTTGISQSKKYEIAVNDAASSKLELINLAGDVKIESGSSDKIIIEADKVKPVPERAKGLKRIGSGGQDNTGLGLNLTKKGKNIRLFGVIAMNDDPGYKIIVPKSIKINVLRGVFNDGNVEINDVSADLELSVKNSDIKLNNITGPTVISSLSGDIEIIFSKVSQLSPFSIKAISGDIDLSLPPATPADLELSSISGAIYTDFDLKTAKSDETDLKHVGGKSKVQAKINGGGVKMRVSAISGNIYFRKKK